MTTIVNNRYQYNIYDRVITRLFNDTTDITIPGGTPTVDWTNTEFTKNSDSVVKVTSDGSTNFEFKVNNIDYDIRTGRSLGFRVYIPDITNLTSIICYALTADNSRFAFKTHNFSNREIENNGWHFLELYQDTATTTLTEDDLAAIGNAKLLINCSDTVTVYFDSLYANWKTKAKCLIYFDDSLVSGAINPTSGAWGDNYLDKYGFKANYALAPETINSNSNFLTTAQVNALVANGHHVVNHGNTNLTTLSIEDAETEVLNDEASLAQFGVKKHYVYPEGGVNSAIVQMLKDNGYKTARQTQNNIGYTQFGDEDSERIFRFGIGGQNASDTDASAAISNIDDRCNEGTMFTLMYHDIVLSGATGTDVLETNFRAVVDHLYDKVMEGVLDVVLAEPWYEGLKTVYEDSSLRTRAIVHGTAIE